MTGENEPKLAFEALRSVPTMVAVAIEADKTSPDGLAKITAAGRGKLAQQILDMAFAKGIKVRTDANLAEILSHLELDTPIPSEAIVAVAEILAKVYEANAAALAADPQPDSLLAQKGLS